MIIHDDVKLDYSDVLLVPGFGGPPSRKDVNIYPELYATRTLPIVAANMDGVGTFEMALELGKRKAMTALVKHYPLDDLVAWFKSLKSTVAYPYTMWSMGINNDDMEKLKAFKKITGLNPSWICIDVANGYMPGIEEFVHEVKHTCPGALLAGGNVVSPRGVCHWLDAGVNLVKVGIGPGSVCTTRTVTGVGYPQFSAVVECVEAAKKWFNLYEHRKSSVPIGIIADGGCTNTGDIVKALGAGAKLVMLGGMLAGHDEGLKPEDPVIINVNPETGQVINGIKPMVRFHGMASRKAQEKHGSISDYRSSEGKEVLIPCRGPVKETMNEIENALRAGCSLVGHPLLELISHKAQFVRVNNQVNRIFG